MPRSRQRWQSFASSHIRREQRARPRNRCENFVMSDTSLKLSHRVKVERPKLYKVILVNDDFTPREFVVMVLKAVFSMSEDQASRVMITAHQRGVCVVAVFARDIAETKAALAVDAAKAAGFPLLFTTEPEE